MDHFLQIQVARECQGMVTLGMNTLGMDTLGMNTLGMDTLGMDPILQIRVPRECQGMVTLGMDTLGMDPILQIQVARECQGMVTLGMDHVLRIQVPREYQGMVTLGMDHFLQIQVALTRKMRSLKEFYLPWYYTSPSYSSACSVPFLPTKSRLALFQESVQVLFMYTGISTGDQFSTEQDHICYCSKNIYTM
ncbi:hypothetical protein HGM15179_016343 [Zosterops borbonicus]|uniref:Uncharacterized protein n=1 Tax=Zosterops borbonicus TaxID=364589 RepID=A0A8K1LEE0_9PASS|nr:hypothetical protein HGM15179_016343 [Zosterops borbonicus]